MKAALGIAIACALVESGCEDAIDSRQLLPDFAVPGEDLAGADRDGGGDLDGGWTGGMDLAGGADLAGAPAWLRIAALAPDEPPLDFCVAPLGTAAFSGPLLAAAGQSGLGFGKVTAYRTLPSGAWVLRVVPAAGGGCTAGPHADLDNVARLAGGQAYTLAAIGFVTPPFGNSNAVTLELYADDGAAEAGAIALRVIHASPDTPPADVGAGAGASFAPLFVDVAYSSAGASAQPPSDANGYVAAAPPAAPPTFSARARGGSTDLLTIVLPAAPGPGSVVTLFLIGDSTGTPRPLEILTCLDNAAPAFGLTSCFTLP